MHPGDAPNASRLPRAPSPRRGVRCGHSPSGCGLYLILRGFAAAFNCCLLMMLGASFLAMGAAARGDTRASFATHDYGSWNCRISDSKKPSPTSAAIVASAGGNTLRRREARAGRTPGTDLSAWRSAGIRPSAVAPRMGQYPGSIPGAPLSLPVPALAEPISRLKLWSVAARPQTVSRVAGGDPRASATGVVGSPDRQTATHAAGGDQFDGGGVEGHARTRAVPRLVSQRPRRETQSDSRYQARPAVIPFRPACADADSPIRDNPR